MDQWSFFLFFSFKMWEPSSKGKAYCLRKDKAREIYCNNTTLDTPGWWKNCFHNGWSSFAGRSLLRSVLTGSLVTWNIKAKKKKNSQGKNSLLSSATFTSIPTFREHKEGIGILRIYDVRNSKFSHGYHGGTTTEPKITNFVKWHCPITSPTAPDYIFLALYMFFNGLSNATPICKV